MDRNDFYYEHTFWGSPRIPKVEGVVSREWKYMKFIEHGYEEVYDLKADPQEKKNLALDPSFKDDTERLRERYTTLKSMVR